MKYTSYLNYGQGPGFVARMVFSILTWLHREDDERTGEDPGGIVPAYVHLGITVQWRGSDRKGRCRHRPVYHCDANRGTSYLHSHHQRHTNAIKSRPSASQRYCTAPWLSSLSCQRPLGLAPDPQESYIRQVQVPQVNLSRFRNNVNRTISADWFPLQALRPYLANSFDRIHQLRNKSQATGVIVSHRK